MLSVGIASYNPEFLFHSITQAGKTLLSLRRSTEQGHCEVDTSRGVRSYTSRAACTCSMLAWVNLANSLQNRVFI
jgi:hypothetical protein